MTNCRAEIMFVAFNVTRGVNVSISDLISEFLNGAKCEYTLILKEAEVDFYLTLGNQNDLRVVFTEYRFKEGYGDSKLSVKKEDTEMSGMEMTQMLNKISVFNNALIHRWNELCES